MAGQVLHRSRTSGEEQSSVYLWISPPILAGHRGKVPGL